MSQSNVARTRQLVRPIPTRRALDPVEQPVVCRGADRRAPLGRNPHPQHVVPMDVTSMACDRRVI